MATKKKPQTKRSAKTKAGTKTKAKAKANSKNAIPESKLKEIVGRLEAGESKLIEESRGLGFTGNNELRAALREHLGGKAKYRAMIVRSMAARKGASDDNGGGKKKRSTKKRKSKAKKK